MVAEDGADHYASHDPDGDARLSTTLVHALADIMENDVTDVGIALGEAIDPEALDRLSASSTTGIGHVALSVADHRVTVYGDGTIVITTPSALPDQ